MNLNLFFIFEPLRSVITSMALHPLIPSTNTKSSGISADIFEVAGSGIFNSFCSTVLQERKLWFDISSNSVIWFSKFDGLEILIMIFEGKFPGVANESNILILGLS